MVKEALEYLFFSGVVGSAGRTSSSSGATTSSSACCPGRCSRRPTPTDEEAFRGSHADRGAGARGRRPSRACATTSGCSPQDSQRAVAELVESGDLLPGRRSRAGGVRPTCTRTPGCPRRVEARALLAPFDPLVWRRERVEVLFDFHYRIEIYVPPEQAASTATTCCRSCSTTRLVARVDLKADRAARAPARAVGLGRAGAPGHTAEELAAELRLMAALARPRRRRRRPAAATASPSSCAALV